MNFAEKEEFKAALGAGLEEEVEELIKCGFDQTSAQRMVITFTIKRLREEYEYRATVEKELRHLKNMNMWMQAAMVILWMVAMFL